MLFDEKYSETISLSKILDCFIIDGEKTSVIVNFLKQYKTSEIFDILSNSLCASRILSATFLHRCSLSERFFLFGIFRDVRHVMDYSLVRILHYLFWQIMRGNFTESEKRTARNAVKSFEKNRTCRFPLLEHPYRGFLGREASKYDDIFFNHIDDENCLFDVLASMDIFDFKSYMENVDRSLWYPRILQIDVFENLEIQKQYVFINSVFSYDKMTNNMMLLHRFARQILCSSTDVHVKNMVFESVSSLGIGPKEEGGYVSMIEESSCYEELIMNMTIYGLDNTAEDVIMHFISYGNKDMLKKMYENNIEILKEYLDITDLIEFWNGNENG